MDLAAAPESTPSVAGSTDGVVTALHRAPRSMLPMKAFPMLRLITMTGVEGDRYASGQGFLTEKLIDLGTTDERHVTLFAQEVLDMLLAEHGVRLALHEHRRNITTRGIDLNCLIGQRFRIGSALLQGFVAKPCKHWEDVVGKPIAPLLIGRAGLNARILEGGDVRLGDAIRIVGPAA